MTFKAGLQPLPDCNSCRFWFIFHNGKLLIKKTAESIAIPTESDIAGFTTMLERSFYFGALDHSPCYAAGLQGRGTLPDSMEWVDLRGLFGAVREEIVWVAGRANQLMDWDAVHRFCGRCASSTADKEDERAKICPQCGLINYPRLSPAVITAVLRDDRILLARNKRFRGTMFSVLAGFVEPGETLEDCVAREILEEVGISVKNIRYFGSQPWPFPNSLMIGFVAEYAGGEILVDDQEIAEAGWFHRSELPPVPPSISIARRLIDWFSASGPQG